MNHIKQIMPFIWPHLEKKNIQRIINSMAGVSSNLSISFHLHPISRRLALSDSLTPPPDMATDVQLGLLALKKLIAHGVDVTVRDHDGRQALLWAASAG